MIGIIGLGYVGKAVQHAFKCDHIISDPKYNQVTIDDVIDQSPDVIFVCLPTPVEDPKFKSILKVIDTILASDYEGVVVVKSTILPQFIGDRDVVCNPEFLTQRTSIEDFCKPMIMVLGGKRASQVLDVYNKYSIVDTSRCVLTDNSTACMVKYTANCFYATKVCFMNIMFDICNEQEADYDKLKSILKEHPWMGSNHFDVPGPDGKRGFGGACLPKDMLMFCYNNDVSLFRDVIKQNNIHRNKS